MISSIARDLPRQELYRCGATARIGARLREVTSVLDITNVVVARVIAVDIDYNLI
jgi:hypothetical protein